MVDRRCRSPGRCPRLRRGDRVLIAEQAAMRVTERDFTGKIYWEHKVTENLVGCKRLATATPGLSPTTKSWRSNQTANRSLPSRASTAG